MSKVVRFDPNKRPSRRVSDYEVALHMREPLKKLHAGTELRVEAQEQAKPKQEEKREASKPEEKAPLASNDQDQAYLTSLHENPHATVTQLQELEGLSAYAANNLRKRLVEMGFIEPFTVNVGRDHGGSVTLTHITESGCKAIDRASRFKLPARMSHEHFWWQRGIAAFYRRHGYDARIEFNLNGKLVDVGFRTKSGVTAIEVELSPKNAVRNVTEDLERGSSRVVVGCKNAKVRQAVESRLKQAIGEQGISRVKLMLLSEFSFVKELFSPGKSGTSDKTGSEEDGS